MWPFKTKEQKKEKRIRDLRLAIAYLEEVVRAWGTIFAQNELSSSRVAWVVEQRGKLARLRLMLEMEKPQDE